jgi:hypothetical protein
MYGTPDVHLDAKLGIRRPVERTGGSGCPSGSPEMGFRVIVEPERAILTGFSVHFYRKSLSANRKAHEAWKNAF